MKMSKLVLLIILLTFIVPIKVYAETSTSTSYSVEESAFSSGSGEGASASFSSQGSAGDLSVGLANSDSYRAYGGPITPNEEYLEMGVTLATIDLDTPSESAGILTNLETATGTATFYVRAYLNSSYVVQTISPPLTSESSDTIAPIVLAAIAAIGTEQFGINLVDNATPDIGANPAPDPSGAFANGEAATGYGTVDQYQYNNGDIIAQNGGNPAWGQTNYTISYIANISGITEAGNYQMQHELVAIPTF
jgi:hypothetical protein